MIVVMCVLAAAGPAAAQGVRVALEDPGLHVDTLDVTGPRPFRLRPFVIPGSETVRLGEALLDTSRYRIDYRHGRLWLEEGGGEALPDPPRLVVAYRTLPFAFRDVYRRRSLDAGAADSTGRVAVVEEAPPAATGFDPFGGSGLQRSGSITRGILAGNNRDVSVESGLRLQLSGEIAEGVDVQAVLTDENTPILPEGTTQRLDEFDRVFIEIGSPVGTAQLGDFDLRFGGTEFARFDRKLQGATAFTDVPAAGSIFGGGRVAVAGATSRGIFRSQQIEPLDGVQGPYRLEGATGERFIIVVPGSEAVYLDGVRLVRGETNDYVIDYATAEVTFTPNRLITADRRITVEFQYSTNQFTRTLVGTQVESRFWPRADGTSRVRFGTTFLREADSRQFGEEFGLSPADSLLLVGDDGSGPIRASSAERVSFDPEAPYSQYVREPCTVDCGSVDSIYVALQQAPAPGVPVYRVRFSRIGPGQGSYAREGQQVNGIVYVFRGQGRGDYEPERILPRPKQQRLLDLHGAVAPLPGLEVFGEWAGSLYDENRLSALDAADDLGNAYLAGLRLQPVGLGFGQAKVSAELRRRFVGADFEAFDRIRPVEFGRQWNLDARPVGPAGTATGSGDEQIDEGFVQLDVTALSALRVEAGRLELGAGFRAQRQEAVLRAAEKGWPLVDYRVTRIASRDTLLHEDGRWFRQLGTLRYPLLAGRLVPRFEVEHERRRQRVIGTDSLARRSFDFVEYRPGLAWATEKLEAGGEVELRVEDDWADGIVRDASRAWTVQSFVRYRPGRSFTTDASVGYRIRRFTEYFRVEQRREDNNSVAVRWNSRFQPLRRAVDLDWRYEALTERTPQLQEIYVRTGPELGQYVWEDADGDGIVEIQEMIPERTPNEGTYALTYIPSDELIPVINVDARIRLELDPSRLWTRPEAGWQKWLSSVATRTTVDVQEKSENPDLARIYLLDLRRFRDPAFTQNGRLRLAQDLLLFRNETRYGLDLSFNQLRGLNKYTAQQEERFLNAWRLDGRYRPGTKWGLRLETMLEQNRVLSDTFSTRRYDIRSLRLEPEASYSPSQSLHFLTGVDYARKRDAFEDRTAAVVKVPVEARYQLVRRLQLSARAEVASVRLGGEAAEGLAQYELTDGRGPGTSFLWNVSGNYAFSSYLRASFSYDGRSPSDAPVIHTVRVQLSALF